MRKLPIKMRKLPIKMRKLPIKMRKLPIKMRKLRLAQTIIAPWPCATARPCGRDA